MIIPIISVIINVVMLSVTARPISTTQDLNDKIPEEFLSIGNSPRSYFQGFIDDIPSMYTKILDTLITYTKPSTLSCDSDEFRDIDWDKIGFKAFQEREGHLFPSDANLSDYEECAVWAAILVYGVRLERDAYDNDTMRAQAYIEKYHTIKMVTNIDETSSVTARTIEDLLLKYR